MKLFRKLNSSDRGASMVEYGLIVAVISMMSVSAVTLLGDSTEETFETVTEAMDTGQAFDGGAVSSAAQEEAADDSDQSSDNSGGSAADDSEDDSQDDSGYEQDSEDDSQGQSDGQDLDDGAGDESDDSNGDTELSDEDDANGDDGEASEDVDDLDGGETDDTGDATGNPGGSGDPSDDSDDDEVAVGHNGSKANPSHTASSFTWWNANKHGGQGEWKASVTFENDWIRHQYLTLKVTTVDHEGKTKTEQVDSFYVPANGSTTFHRWGNFMKDHKGEVRGVMEVHVQVVNVKTSDEAWKPVSFPQDSGSVSTVKAPATP